MTITRDQKIEELKLSMGLAYSRETAEVFRAILADYEAPYSVHTKERREFIRDMAFEIDRLRTLNAELIESIECLLPYATACIGLPRSLWPTDSVMFKAEAAIAKAKGETV